MWESPAAACHTPWGCAVVVELRHVIISALNSQLPFLKDFNLFIFRERGREGEKEGEKYRSVASRVCRPGTEPVIQACAPTGNRTGDRWLCGTTPKQPTEPHRQGQPAAF